MEQRWDCIPVIDYTIIKVNALSIGFIASHQKHENNIKHQITLIPYQVYKTKCQHACTYVGEQKLTTQVKMRLGWFREHKVLP